MHSKSAIDPVAFLTLDNSDPQTGIALCRRTDGQARFPLKEGAMTDKIIIYGKAG